MEDLTQVRERRVEERGDAAVAVGPGQEGASFDQHVAAEGDSHASSVMSGAKSEVQNLSVGGEGASGEVIGPTLEGTRMQHADAVAESGVIEAPFVACDALKKSARAFPVWADAVRRVGSIGLLNGRKVEVIVEMRPLPSSGARDVRIVTGWKKTRITFF
jgi:hypothetical protein